MAFDPLDPTTWHDDPLDFIVPPHVVAADMALAEHLHTSDTDEEAQVRAFLGLDRWGISEEQKAEAMRQVMASRQAIHDALQSLSDAEAAMDEDDQSRCPHCGHDLIDPADLLTEGEEES